MSADGATQTLAALAEQAGALRTGEFTLKSGRKSDIFFNMGAISSGEALASMGQLYAEAAQRHWNLPDEVDVLFGPAYKGIPLAVACALALAAKGVSMPVAYDRKEAKQHGEGGQLVGAEVSGKKVLLLDDVLTAGTAMRQSVQRLRQAGAIPVGLLVALNRCEPADEQAPSAATAAEALQAELDMPIRSIATLPELRSLLAAGAH